MKVLDLFCGLKGWSDPFAELGHQVVTSDIEERFGPTIVSDIMDLTAQQVLDAFGGHPPDIILASPPCEKFSVATIGRNWNHDHTPKTDGAREAKVLVQKTLELITQLGGVRYWVLENPRAMLRKMPFMDPYPRTTVTYCQYGESHMKPTDLWGYWPPGFNPRKCAGRYAPEGCHERAPRGSKTGTQGIKGAAARGKIPRGLALEMCRAAERVLE